MKNEDIVQISRINQTPGTFEIRWRVTNLCNYQCDFCIQGNHRDHVLNAGNESREQRQIITRALTRLICRSEGFDTVKIGLIGGEVTILPDLAWIVEQLAG